MRQIIIDGYNVIRADPRLQSLEQVSLQTARDVLVRTLASSPRLSNDRILVVFDGRGGTRGHIHSHRVGRIDTMYSARGQTAVKRCGGARTLPGRRVRDQRVRKSAGSDPRAAPKSSTGTR